MVDTGITFHRRRYQTFKKFIEQINTTLEVVGRALGHRVWQSVEYYLANYPDVRAAQKELIEEMNKARTREDSTKDESTSEASVSRPVEYYIEKYPDVRAAYDSIDQEKLANALHTAFEDQLVQKVMPKLRGIDTRGKSKTDCLDKILAQINEGINDKPFNLEPDFKLACELGYGQFIWNSANYLKEEDLTNEIENDLVEINSDDNEVHPSEDSLNDSTTEDHQSTFKQELIDKGIDKKNAAILSARWNSIEEILNIESRILRGSGVTIRKEELNRILGS